MDTGLKTKRRYHILFFVLRKNRNDSVKDENRSKKRKCSKWGRQWVVITAILLVLYTVFSKPHLFTNLSHKISNYININWNLTIPEVRHVGFLKVHKAGGSTIQNILFRFGIRRNVSFVMPVTQYKLSEFGKVPYDILNNKQGHHFDILTIHSVYNESVYARLLPRDAARVAIVRDPLEVMVSGAYYHRDVWGVDYLRKVPNDNYIKNLILFPEMYDNNEFSLTRNSMAMDFGFPKGLHCTESDRVQHYLSYLNENFDLVMILERFDESLVLLKRLLRWTLKDILYIPQNTHHHPAISDLNLSSSDISKFELRNFLDVSLYHYFSNIFKSKVLAAGDDFKYEVEHLQSVVSKVTDYCVFHERHSSSRDLTVYQSDWNAEFTVNAEDCREMMTSELYFIDKIRSDVKLNLRGVYNKTFSFKDL
ncbi:galactose-3-O-sulfotransferase 2-like isoform X1 [Mya arenaria]|uniref:galactose-3-O-sulfotransferase 2-like isoform X1 n=1 Tax=Mya arenaria TaxID=6604 RepID=UPI0022E3AA32|nr:galactose-3-O-sulfotransferase 2-like isoform X1 [Mya arenaria]